MVPYGALETCHINLGEPKCKENCGFVGYVVNLTLERLGNCLAEVGSGSVCLFPYGNF